MQFLQGWNGRAREAPFDGRAARRPAMSGRNSSAWARGRLRPAFLNASDRGGATPLATGTEWDEARARLPLLSRAAHTMPRSAHDPAPSPAPDGAADSRPDAAGLPPRPAGASRIERWFERYGGSHRHPANKAIHRVCVPLISWSLLAALWAWTPLAAAALVVAALVFYLTLSPPIALGMLVPTAMMLAPLPFIGGALLPVAAIVFVVAWLGQFAGHHLEGRRPSFADDLRFLLIGPAWLLGSVYRRLGVRY
jgi:uncharacterized membrane protein YGL010W